ncbi:MAG: flavin monoamine oxidase family protein [Flavisolibacter sp.]
MKENLFDVIIVGAGACGLMAALELVQTGKKTAVIEARDRVGGRIDTQTTPFSATIERGAEFIHGDLPLSKLLLKKARAGLTRVTGDLWKMEEGKLQEQGDFIEDFSDLEKKCRLLDKDIPVARFLEEQLQGDRYEDLRFTLKNYVEGYYAGDTQKTSTKALCQELTTADDVQYRIKGGYKMLSDFLALEAGQKGCSFILNRMVTALQWEKDRVVLLTPQEDFVAKKVLVTVPLGVLQAGKISFSPALDEKLKAARQLGFGPVIKVILIFKYRFWSEKALEGGKDLDHLGFLFSRETIPTWWTQHPDTSTILTGWVAGPRAESLKNLPDAAILEKALLSLERLFRINSLLLRQQLLQGTVVNWAADPYSCGGYAYEVVGGETFRQQLEEPVAQTLFFAGEGLYHGPEIGTVEAALVTGRETAHRIIASFPGTG